MVDDKTESISHPEKYPEYLLHNRLTKKTKIQTQDIVKNRLRDAIDGRVLQKKLVENSDSISPFPDNQMGGYMRGYTVQFYGKDTCMPSVDKERAAETK